MSDIRNDEFPKISFGIIVFNGSPFTKYCLRQIYPFAHEIIVVEGATCNAVDVSESGHSNDGTLEALYEFKEKEDPERKLQIVTRSGFWSEKDEQSNAYAQRATGDYLWQVDIDEFYRSEDMQIVVNLLRQDPSISGMSFKTLTFWGSVHFITNSYILEMGAGIYRRLFKWGQGYRYVTHRPPTVVDPVGADAFGKNWLGGRQLAGQSLCLYHYSLLFPKQVEEKCLYYSRAKLDEHDPMRWYHESYERVDVPFRFHNLHSYPSWLERFDGRHPEQVEQLWDDIQKGAIPVRVRENQDVEELLEKRSYRLRRAWLRLQVRLALVRRSLVHSFRTRKVPRSRQGLVLK